METNTKNQCDGCLASLPLKGNIHYKDGKAEMVCQRGKYLPRPIIHYVCRDCEDKGLITPPCEHFKGEQPEKSACEGKLLDPTATHSEKICNVELSVEEDRNFLIKEFVHEFEKRYEDGNRCVEKVENCTCDMVDYLFEEADKLLAIHEREVEERVLRNIFDLPWDKGERQSILKFNEFYDYCLQKGVDFGKRHYQ